ncbi:MAG: homoaconitate hydratase [Candidatus Lokiarchaeota archaeon]|nr:homoaconitate hydratase [Candidatus Lokiarchaeota archaeon]
MNKNSDFIYDNEYLENFNLYKDNIPSKIPKKIQIWDETLRDGQQTPGVNLDFDQTIEIARLLDEIGVSVIAVGYPAVSKEEKETVKKIASDGFKAKIAAPARAVKSDINHSLDCNVDEIPIFFPISDLALKKVIKISFEDALDRICTAIQYSVDHGVITDFIAMDASRTKIEKLDKLFRAAFEVGANKVVIADTTGFLRPVSMSYLVNEIKKQAFYEKKCISIHCHNDLGLANANTLAAIEMGANYPHVCVNGYGERSGNCALEELVLSLEIQYGIKTGIKMEKLYELSQLTENLFGLPLSIHKPIVGMNSFSHESGLHVNAILTGGGETIEPYSPRLIGRRRRYFVGKYSGRSSIEHVLKLLNVELTKEEIEKILIEIKKPRYIKEKEAVETMNKIRKELLKSYSGVPATGFLKILKNVTGKIPNIDKKTLNEYSVIF